MKMEQKMSEVVFLASLLRKLCCLLVMPGFIGATSLTKVKPPDANPVRIGSAKANDFLANFRPKRNADPKWYQSDPDFQSYYSFYNSIGHVEGLYEIDRIRMLYQQMRHLELNYGPDAASYQNKMGAATSTAVPATTTRPPAPPTAPAPTPDPLENAEKFYLCNPRDPLCKPRIVYLPTGAVPILCDPRLNLACSATKEEGVRNITPSQPTPATPAPGKAVPPVPPPVTKKGMEYDCDPYWDPDCLVDQPPHPAQEASSPVAPDEETTDEGNVPVVLNVAKKKRPGPYFDPYDFKSDLYDPYRYAEPAPDPQ
ncbi:leucine-rich repeat extensin-like protein 5 [Poecilia formosa]|nr:PREDICTED: leucine-rich repeat extensin-like protein 5 [Poecilia formosa]